MWKVQQSPNLDIFLGDIEKYFERVHRLLFLVLCASGWVWIICNLVRSCNKFDVGKHEFSSVLRNNQCLVRDKSNYSFWCQKLRSVPFIHSKIQANPPLWWVLSGDLRGACLKHCRNIIIIMKSDIKVWK